MLRSWKISWLSGWSQGLCENDAITPAASSTSARRARESAGDPRSGRILARCWSRSGSLARRARARLPPRPRRRAAGPSRRSPSGPSASRTAATWLVGNHQHVHRRLRIDVPEGQRVVRALDDRRRNLARHDPAEQAVSHGPPLSARGVTAAAAARAAVSNRRVWAPGARAGSPPRRSARRSSRSVRPPGRSTTVTGLSVQRRRRRRHRAASASQRVPSAGSRDELRRAARERSTSRRPGRPALLDGLERRAPELVERERPRERVATPPVRSVSSGTIRSTPSSAAFSTSQANRSRSPAPTASVSAAGGARRSARLDLHHATLAADRDQASRCRRARRRRRTLDRFALARAPHPQVMLPRARRGDPLPRAAQRPGGTSTVHHGRAGGDRPPAGVARLVARRRTRPRASTGRNSGGLRLLHAGEDREAARRERGGDRRAAARCSRCGGCWRGAGRPGRAAAPGRRVAVEELDPVADAVPLGVRARRPRSPRRRSRCRWRGRRRASPRRWRGCRCRCRGRAPGRPGGGAARAASARRGWSRARRCRTPFRDRARRVASGRSARRRDQDGTTVSRPNRRGPSPSRQRVRPVHRLERRGARSRRRRLALGRERRDQRVGRGLVRRRR